MGELRVLEAWGLTETLEQAQKSYTTMCGLQPCCHWSWREGFGVEERDQDRSSVSVHTLGHVEFKMTGSVCACVIARQEETNHRMLLLVVRHCALELLLSECSGCLERRVQEGDGAGKKKMATCTTSDPKTCLRTMFALTRTVLRETPCLAARTSGQLS